MSCITCLQQAYAAYVLSAGGRQQRVCCAGRRGTQAMGRPAVQLGGASSTSLADKCVAVLPNGPSLLLQLAG